MIFKKVNLYCCLLYLLILLFVIYIYFMKKIIILTLIFFIEVNLKKISIILFAVYCKYIILLKIL